MERRKFVQSLGTLSALSIFGDTFLEESFKNLLYENDVLKALILQNDKSVANLLEQQQKDTQHPFYGGWPDKFEIYHPGSISIYCGYLVAAYVSPISKFHQSEEVKNTMNLAVDFLLRVQHDDGTIDLLTTNFHSTPDVAFSADRMAMALMVLKNHHSNQLKTFQSKASLFLKRGGEALTIGGIHTPNHRWVVCRALARIYTLFPDKKYLDRIQDWLEEGIDIDSDGQYTEKSSTVYSPIVNDCFITVARLLNKPELYDPVRKNLDMSLYFVHANGEVVTEASTRQDQFKIESMVRYYYVYRYMALFDQNPIYAAMTKWIQETVGLNNFSSNAIKFLEEPMLVQDLPKGGKLPTNYVKHFPDSKMVRIRRGEVDATILAENYTFFTFFKGAAALQGVRVASAFFGKGQFESEQLKIEEGKYILIQELTGPYYQPHLKENIDPDGNWEKMPRKLRPQSEVQHYKAVISITESNGTFDIHFSIGGTDRIPVAIELAFRKGGELRGVSKVEDIEHTYLLKDGQGEYQVDNQVITFGSGQTPHNWTQLRGAKEKLNGDCVYITGYTPFDYVLSIK